MNDSWFLPLLILALVTGCIEVDISVPGFPAMAQDFEVPQSVIQLTLAYNFLGFCIAALFYGPLADRWGRRPVMIIGNGIMVLGAGGCLIASDISTLLIARFIQGIGASASAVVVFAITADVYKGDRLIKVLTLINSALTIVMALAPVMGGAINSVIGWQGNYGMVALISGIAWLLLIVFLPETKQKNLLPLRGCKAYQQLLRHGQFMAHALMPSLFYIGYIVFISCSSFLYIQTFGVSVLEYVLHQAIIVGAFTVMNFFCSSLIHKIGKKGSIIVSLGICFSSGIGCLFLNKIGIQGPIIVTAFMMVYSCGFSIGYPAVFADSLEFFPHQKGAAVSLIMCLRNGLCAGFVGLASFFYNGQMQSVFSVLLLCLAIAFLNGLWILNSKNEHLNN